ncbi:serine/threonine protein kinase [Nocardia concava]|uniref:serine/threonine protein kinase n=1 Tax=Nocardia concava TaxID=257281 RepID=UPI0002E2142A|nr:serine/threonine-protein kinase [Nocardia concava]
MKPLTPRDPRWLGRNRMIAVIGRGGMGRVLLGRAPTGKLVAVKHIHQHLADDPGFRLRFRREVEAGRQLTGAYTAAVVDSDTGSESPWLATEYVAAPDLRAVVERCGPMHLGGLRLLATGLAAALVEIHRAGLVHRDLNPGNVLLTEDGPRVIDFGIVRALESDDPQLTATGGAIGSPAYMAPEQAEGAAATPAADLFSAGAILTLAASGTSPFPGNSTPQVLYHVMHSPPDTQGVPPSLRELVNACLARDPARRPTAQQLLDAAAHLPAEPVWPEPVRATIAAHRADSDWWAQTAEREASYRDELERLRIRRRDRIRWLAVATVAVLALSTFAVGVGHWARSPGHAVPMADPSLTVTPAELRELDGCALMDRALRDTFGTRSSDLETFGTNGCETDYTDKDKGKKNFTLFAALPSKEVLAHMIPTGRTVAWAPILESNRPPDHLCERGMILPNSEQDGLEMWVQGTGSDDELCAAAEASLTAVVEQLARYAPRKHLPQNSILRVDPCLLLDPTLSRTLAGDPARRTDTVDQCLVEGSDFSFLVRFSEELRPDISVSGEEIKTRSIGSATAYVNQSETHTEYCNLKYIARLTTGNQAEVVELNLNRWTGTSDSCDKAAQLLADVLSRLPKS